MASALLVGSVAVWAAGPAQAAACPLPGGFEIDGNLTQLDCTPSGQDWNTPGLGVATATQGGTYSTAGKDDTNPSTWVSTGSTPDKTDFARAYAFAKVVGGQYYAFVGWERTASKGTQGYAIEIDNSDPNVAADGTPQPNRSNGGYVFYISSQGSSLPTFGGACTFTSQATYAACSNNSAGFTAAFNTTDITDPFTTLTVKAGGFNEVALNITQLTGIAPACPAPSKASLYLRSITGQTTNGNLKGYLQPVEIAPPSTCIAPDVTTTATPGGALVAPGSAQHDVATVSAPTGSTAGTPTGSVAFYLCSPAQVTAAGCPTGGTKIGSSVALSSGSATSADTTATTALGKYCWRAEYTPDTNGAKTYLPATHTNATTECFTVVHASPTISTQIAVTGDNAPGLGFTTLGDTATLAGFIGSVQGEPVTFKLYGPYADGVIASCTGAPVFQTTGALSAGGVATTSGTFTPTAAGTYVWIASYGGNALNDSATGKCSDANERATVVGAKIDVAKSANPPGPVSAGQTIGFDITVSNAAKVPATGVVVTDKLPAGGSLNWTLDPAYTGCSVTGAVGSQTLTCSLNTVPGNTTLPVIHVSSPTTPADCGVINNQASITTTNGTGGDSDVASVRVNCANVTLTKTADAASVSAGSQIGFTVTASNSSAANTGTALGVTINDPLPGGPGVSWSIASGPANCAIQGSAPNQTLVCSAVNLAAGASESVHVVSNTGYASCATYNNTATLTGSNVGDLKAGASTQVLCPTLTLTKTAAASPVNAGSDISFTITLSNAGPGTATNATISDPLPGGAGVNWSISPAVPGCAITGAVPDQTLSCAFPTLASGASQAVTVTSGTAYASCGTYPNEATAGAANYTPGLKADASITVECASLDLTKTADAALVTAGTDIGFTITASNSGPGTASAVTIVDPLPSGVTWSVSPAVDGCSIASGTLTCTVGDLGADKSFSVHVSAPTNFAACGAYRNTATLTSSNNPSVQASASTTVQCPALSIEKTADAATVNAGESIGFTITVSNATAEGTGTATGVTLNDPLPSGTGVQWTIASGPGQGSCVLNPTAPQTLSCSFGDLARGGAVSVHVVGKTTYDSCATYANTASTQATNHGRVDASATTTVQCPDLAITKTADAASVDAGDQIGFVVSVSNAGPGTAAGVSINDPLPGGDGVNWTIGSQTGENCSITGDAPTQTLVCDAVDLPAESSIMVHVVSGTEFASCGTYSNTASYLAGNAPGDSSDTVTTQVRCSDLSLTKVADSDTAVTAGDPIGFTVSVANGDGESTGTAKNVVISDPLPAGPEGSGVVWSLDPGYDGPCQIAGDQGSQTLTCSLGDLEPGASTSVHVSSPTAFGDCAQYDNTASLTADNAPGLTASASTVVACPALALTKVADDASVVRPNTIGFTITAGNTGAAPATATVLNDPLPKGTGIDWSIDPAYDGPGTCSIEGAVGSQVLTCDFGTVPPGGSTSVHVVSATTNDSCQVYTNTASLSAANGPGEPLEATAKTTVTGCKAVAPVPPVTRTPTPTPTKSTGPLAVTGAGPLGAELAAALLLLVGGGVLTVAATRRRRAH